MVNAANKPITPITLVLVAGSNYQAREAWIATAIAALPPQENAAVLLEGLPTGVMSLQAHTHLLIERIAPGCFCCIGQLALRVTLNRLIKQMTRQNTKNLFIAINDAQHVTALQQSLTSPPYDQLLQTDEVIML